MGPKWERRAYPHVKVSKRHPFDKKTPLRLRMAESRDSALHRNLDLGGNSWTVVSDQQLPKWSCPSLATPPLVGRKREKVQKIKNKTKDKPKLSNNILSFHFLNENEK